MPIQTVFERDFESEVLRSGLPVLVDLYADWCAPCKQLEPVLEQLALELEGKLKITRVDVEQNPILTRSFRVQSIPMLVLFNQGRPVDQIVGAVDKKALLDFVKPVLTASTTEIEPKELAVLINQQRVVAIDVREASAYKRYRIPGAINIPATEIMNRLTSLRSSDGRMRVLYSRSDDEAKDLVDRVRDQGIEVGYLKGGFLHWEADGLEVERGS